MALTILLAILLIAALLHARVTTTRHEARVDRLLALAEAERARLTSIHTQALALTEQARSKPHPDIAALIDLTDRLCQRVQAPEHAITEHAQAQPVGDLQMAVLPDDDEGWHKAQGFSKEELADRLAEAELNGG